ncbi:MAG: hypothetical protein E7029_05575 [Planctomycetaceae bacterium]|nr:hypothetical protein [Planctomycetaceae bacterium]
MSSVSPSLNFDTENSSQNSLDTLLPEIVNYDMTQFAQLRAGYDFGPYQNYRLIRKLGEGGMGQTWLANEMVNGKVSQQVVLKLLSRELRGNAEALREVQRVFDLTKNLNHSNICPLLGRYSDPYYGDFLVMKYADGGTLADRFKHRPNQDCGLTAENIVKILRPIAFALDHAHKMGILHRDVKPQNIMFIKSRKMWTPVLIDFGIAARIRPENAGSTTMTYSRTDTMAHSTSGTPLYMAPEQMKGEKQDGRADQYALAMIVFELLNGKLPFAGKNVIQITMEKTTLRPENPNFPIHVNAALTKALSTEPKNRFSTCTEFIDALVTPLKPIPVSDQKKKISKASMDQLIQILARSFRTLQTQVQERPYHWAGAGGVFFLLVCLCLFMSGDGETPEISTPAPLPPISVNEPKETPKEPEIVRKAGEKMVKLIGGREYTFRWCPPGKFQMGSLDVEIGRDSDEGPRHKVVIEKGFWILDTEVTQALWESVMGKTQQEQSGELGVNGVGENLPVYHVNWDDCRQFCLKLSKFINENVSLPTEAQWEYACRAGTPDPFAGFVDSMAIYGLDHTKDKPYTVAMKAPNDWGLYDMHGNVWEWCADWYSPNYENANSGEKSDRTCRGGGWYDSMAYCRSASRHSHWPGARENNLGFRVVLTAEPDPEMQYLSPLESALRGKFEYTLTETACEITKYIGSVPNVQVPEGVTRIGNDAFRNCTVLRTVTIPDSVTSIGTYAFSDCTNLTSVKLPGNLQAIEKDTFHNCFALTDIEIPNSVESLGAGAFSHCTELEKLHIPDGVKSIGGYCFDTCKKLQEIHIPDSVKSIGGWCFSRCEKLQTVTLPKDLEKLGESMFNECWHLKSIQLPNKLKSIPPAFSNAHVSSLEIPEGVTRIENNAFIGAYALTSLTLPDSLEFIGESVFTGCNILKEINISKNHSHFKLVDGVLFSKDGKRLIFCPRNKTGEYKIPQGTVEVAHTAFHACTSLISVTIPASVSKFSGHQEPFSGSTQLTEIIVEEGNEHYHSIDGVLFASKEKKLIQYPCAKTGEYRIPEGTVAIGWGAFWKSGATSIIIPEGVKQLENHLFGDNPHLTYLRLPASLKEIKSDTFRAGNSQGNPKLAVIDLAKDNPHFKSVDGVLFTADGKGLIRCPACKLGEYTLPKGVTHIYPYAFCNTKITSITFPEGCKSIGLGTFEHNWQLTEAHIPASVTEIGGWCFCTARNLTIYAPKGSKAEEYAKSNGHKFQAVKE